MNKKQIKSTILLIAVAGAVSSCGGDNSADDRVSDAFQVELVEAYFRDEDSSVGALGGRINAIYQSNNVENMEEPLNIRLYWQSENGQKIEPEFLHLRARFPDSITVPDGTNIPEGVSQIRIEIDHEKLPEVVHRSVRFHDFTGNVGVSGPGGNYEQSWYYGIDRPQILANRTEESGGLCRYDNGLVAVTDMNNTRDMDWENKVYSPYANRVNDDAFPPYQFTCSASPINEYKAISDDWGIWTYSTLNDAMFYGTVVYDTFLKYLGEPPLDEKIRLRVHYGNEMGVLAAWDGAYASFSDAYGTHYSTATLDIIAHEVAHGVLARLSALKIFPGPLSDDAITLHESFSDISGVMVKHEFGVTEDLWIHGAEADGWVRVLSAIETETSAIPSYLDYQEAGSNPYLRIGIMTYPFYLLAQQWGIEATYKVYLKAATSCWQPDSTLPQAAMCIQLAASDLNYSSNEVADAFKSVKIRLFDEGVLSHFGSSSSGRQWQFSDNSYSSSTVTNWEWDFGDGTGSTVANPSHVYDDTGVYTVRLSVTDQLGYQDYFQRTVRVTE